MLRIRGLFYPGSWIRDGLKVRIRIRDEQLRSYFLVLRNHFLVFLGLKNLNSLMRIRDGDSSDPGWKKVGSGIRDKHPGSTTLPGVLNSVFTWMEGDKESLEKVRRRVQISMIFGLRSQQYEEKLRTWTLPTGGEKTSAGHDSDLHNFEGSGQCEKIYLVYITPASEGQVRVTRTASDPLNVRQQKWCGFGMFIPDPGSEFFHPGEFFPFRIPDPHL